jgi:hypothetical protein
VRDRELPGKAGVFGDAEGQTRLNGVIPVNRHGDDLLLAGFAEDVVAALRLIYRSSASASNPISLTSGRPVGNIAQKLPWV